MVRSEGMRVKKAGGVLDKQLYENGEECIRINKPGKEYPSLAMTRCFGNCEMQTLGVICDPEVLEWKLLDTYTDPILIVASDGIWEFMSSDTVAKFVLEEMEQGRSRDETVLNLKAKAQQHWLEEEETYCDDITVVIVSINELRRRVTAPESN